MPRGFWSSKDERQYKHVKASCVRRKGPGHVKVCTKIAAATVNKLKAERGETRSFGRHCPRGTRPLAGDKTRCYDPSTRRRVSRTP